MPSSLPARLAGVIVPVDRATYVRTGVSLMALKYAVEATTVFLTMGSFYSPLAFFSPILMFRAEAVSSGGLNAIPPWMSLLYVLWNLPFIWVGVSMSVRRARDAGLPPWLGLLFFSPMINFLLMLALSITPSRPPTQAALLPLRGSDRVVWSAMTGVIGGSAIGLGMVLFSVFLLGEYGAAMFVGTPMVMGMVSGFFLNLRQPQGLIPNLFVGALTVTVSAGLLLLFALEGLLCISMAAPICFVLSLLGVALGRGLAQVEARRTVLACNVALPLLAIFEPAPTQERQVETTIDIAAPPQAVWDAVISFGGVELPPPPEWYFQLGIAHPVRARIEGSGPGAVRYCEFSTGPFVEPITVWDEPYHLAFDVTESPPTMHEWSPYQVINAPHLDGILKSRHGEFRLEPLPDGGTRLIGRTWYTFDMAPEPYWGLWSDAAIHRIHSRVLKHIRTVAEG